MGDMADFALDEVMDEDEFSVNYSGTYCDEEAGKEADKRIIAHEKYGADTCW